MSLAVWIYTLLALMTVVSLAGIGIVVWAIMTRRYELYRPVQRGSELRSLRTDGDKGKETMTTLLPLAIELAARAHGTTMNKDGTPYILHPLRLMMRAKNETEQIVAVLHDTIEDTDLTLEAIRAAGIASGAFGGRGFTIDILDALERLTKRDGEEYQAFLERIAVDPLAIRVKLLDLYDNIDVTRLFELTDWDLKRTAKYHAAIRFLEQKLKEFYWC